MTTVNLPVSHVTAYEWDPIFSPFGTGDGFGNSNPAAGTPVYMQDGIIGGGARGALYNWALANYDAITQKIKNDYAEKHNKLPGAVDAELASVRDESETKALNPVEEITRDLTVHNTVIARKTLELARLEAVANAHFGSSPIDKTAFDIATRFKERQLLNVVKQSWSDSYVAAYNALLLSEGIALLNAQSVALKQALLSAQARIAAEKAAADKAAADAAAKAERDKQADADKTKDEILWATNFYKEVSERFGEKASVLAKELAENAKGKKIRNADEAIQTFNKYKDAINQKFGAKDREAIVNAINALDMQILAKNLANASKVFGGVSKVVDVAEVAFGLRDAVRTGEWKPLLLKLEAIAVGGAATFIVAAIFGITAATPLGILAFAVLMAATSAYVDDKFIAILNKEFFGI